jgi:hypothetical protein
MDEDELTHRLTHLQPRTTLQLSMNSRRLAAAVAMMSLLTQVHASAADDDATLLRVFLRDGTSLVSYGEFARVADRVIFPLPTSKLPNPSLQLVSVPADRVDWDRTNHYSETARAARYASTRAESDYVAISNAVARTLNDVSTTTDPTERLAIVEAARKTLAEWPQSHFNHRLTEVHQMLSMLDEAIADLRVAAGASRFELSLVAVAAPPVPNEPLLPAPTPVESIEQLLAAAELADSPAERQSLLNVALVDLDRDGPALPTDWAAATRAKAKRSLEFELQLDRSYQTVIRGAMLRADAQARFADVRGIQRVLDGLHQSDDALGRRRPEMVDAAIGALEARLDGARRLQLARDRWAIRAPVLREYSRAMTTPLAILRRLEVPLGNIKALSGSSPTTLALVHRQAARVLRLMNRIVPPEECRAAHALLINAVHLADNAALTRRSAAVAGNITRAWDASSAAAGALMLGAKAKMDIQSAVNRPQLQ